MNKFDQIANKETIDKTIEALKTNGIDAEYVATGEEAKQKVLSFIPEGAEVFNNTSVTIDSLGIADALNNSGKYNAVRNKLNSMNRETQGLEMQKLGAAPEYAVGSVHAVTENGSVLIASNSGSNLPSNSYASAHIIWVIGGQKIVKDTEEGMKRVYEYVLPLESERAHKAYGVPGSFVSKLLIINREKVPGRIKAFIVGESLGF